MESFHQSSQEGIRGWLEKKTGSFWRQWEYRYYILNNRLFQEFLDNTQEKPIISVNFDQVSVTIDYLEDRSPEEIHISLSGHSTGFSLRSSQSKILKKWVEVLFLNISESEGTKRVLSLPPSLKVLRYLRVSLAQFESSAESGDVLLFAGKDLTSKIQRKLTFSKYDHVGLIIKYSNDCLAILEATCDTGVQILYWDDFTFMRWHELYKRLTFRKLLGQKPRNFSEKLQSFTERVVGKKYSLNPTKLFKSLPEETFFCSELVAAAYKDLEVLPDSETCSSYLPVHFSDKKKLSLCNFSLGPEYLIDFTL